MYKIFRFSGKDYNDFGRYKACESSKEFSYLLGIVDDRKKLSNPLSVGLCLPAVCQESDLNAMKPYFLPIINEMVPQKFWNVKGLNLTHLQLNSNDIQFVNSSDLNEKVFSFDKLSFGFIVLMIVLFLIAILCSVISQMMYKKHKKEYRQKRRKLKELAKQQKE